MKEMNEIENNIIMMESKWPRNGGEAGNAQ